MARVREARGKAAGKARGSARRCRIDHSAKVPGPSPSPASNIIMADVIMRMGSYLLRRSVERGFLKGRYGKQTARDILDNRTMSQTLASVAIARLATSSLPGAAIVASGMAAKVLLDRSKRRRLARAEGDRDLLATAEDA